MKNYNLAPNLTELRFLNTILILYFWGKIYSFLVVFWTCSDEDDELPLIDRLGYADGKKDV